MDALASFDALMTRALYKVYVILRNAGTAYDCDPYVHAENTDTNTHRGQSTTVRIVAARLIRAPCCDHVLEHRLEVRSPVWLTGLIAALI